MLSGVTATTKQNLQLGAGVLLSAFTPGSAIVADNIIGATRGGGSFTAVPTNRQIEADGMPDNTKGFQINDFWVATLNTTLIECTEEGILLALGGGASAVTVAELTTITAKNDIVDADYGDLYWVGDTADGKKLAIKLANALNTGGFNFTISNRGEGTFAIAAVANYAVSDLNTAPFEIYIDKTVIA